MKTVIELPRAFEAKSVTYNKEKNQVVIEHRFGQGQSIVPAVYLSCEGANGNASRSAIMLHGNLGTYTIRTFDEEKTMAFDLPPDEYAEEVKKRKGRNAGALKGSTKAADGGSEFRE